MLNNAAKVLAPAIGTASSSPTSEAVALLMSLVFSAASACAFAFIRSAPVAEPGAATAGPASVASPDLMPPIWIAATCAFFIFMVNNPVPLVLEQSGFDKSLLGLLVSSSGAGNILAGLWQARRPASSAAPAEVGSLMRPAMLQALGFGAIAGLLWLRPGPVAALLPVSFFVIGSFSARYAIALNLHVSRHHAASIGHTWGVLQAWQSTMLFVAPLVGAFVLFLALRSAGVPRFQASCLT